jgi:hypothetical protein
MTTTTTRTNEIRAQIEELQMWFARKPYGWSASATPQQLQQWADREKEMDRLNERLIDLL